MAKGSCTHLTLTRLYDAFDCSQCSLCHRRPPLGWLYRCTQDFDGFLPASDFSEAVDPVQTEYDVQLFTLSHSVSEAANAGHYTDEQLRRLWQQKGEVRKLIQYTRPMTAGSDTASSSSSYSLPTSTTTSTLRSSTCDGEPDFCSELSARHPLHAIQESHDNTSDMIEPRPTSIVRLAFTSPCDFKVCHTCRPTYRDRAWLSLNAVVDGALKIPSRHEFDNRRIADVNVVRNIGALRLTQRLSTQTHYDVVGKSCKRRSHTEFSNTVRKMLRQSQQFSDDEEHIDQEQEEIQPRRIEEETQFLAENVCQHADDSATSEAYSISNARRHGSSGSDSGPPHTRADSQLFMHIQHSARSVISEPDESLRSQQCCGDPISSSAMPEIDLDSSHGDNHDKESSGATASTRGGLYLLSGTKSQSVQGIPMN